MWGSSSVAPVASSTCRASTARPVPRVSAKPAVASTTRSSSSWHAVAPNLEPRFAQQVGGQHAVTGDEPLHVLGGRVAGRAGVDDDHAAPGPAQHQRCAQTGGAAADDRDVVRVGLHAANGAHQRRGSHASLPFLERLGNVASMGHAQPAAIPDVLAEVGFRLRRLRERRGVTLTALAAETGISKSTLSRLESGQRKPSLELLLPLAKAHHLPLDELVGAPRVGDPQSGPGPVPAMGGWLTP